MTVLIWRLGVAHIVILIWGQEDDDTHMVAWIKGLKPTVASGVKMKQRDLIAT